MHKIYGSSYCQAALLLNFVTTQLGKNTQHHQHHLQMKNVTEKILAHTEILLK